MAMHEIDIKKLNMNPFSMLGDDWALVTSGDKEKYNTMTVSWGGAGVLWGKNVATIYIRPQRYTYEFLEKNNLFTISFFPKDKKSALSLCGSKSGRDIDKASAAKITPVFFDGTTSFGEANLVLVCKKLYSDDIKPAKFIDNEIDGKNYPGRDYHRFYIGEIIKAYSK